MGTTISVNLTEETSQGPNFAGITLKDAAGNTVQAGIDYSSYFDEEEWEWYVNPAIIVIDPVANLEMGKTYTVTVPADSVRDKDGNPNGQYSFSFNTPFLVTATSTREQRDHGSGWPDDHRNPERQRGAGSRVQQYHAQGRSDDDPERGQPERKRSHDRPGR